MKTIKILCNVSGINFNDDAEQLLNSMDVHLYKANLVSGPSSIFDAIINECRRIASEKFDYIHCVFVDNVIQFKPEMAINILTELETKPFICLGGFNPKIPQQVFFEKGSIILDHFYEEKAITLPLVNLCGIEIENRSNNLCTYSRFLCNRFLDIELAAYAASQRKSFTVHKLQSDFNKIDNAEYDAKYLREKAAVWNSVFLFNCFDLDSESLHISRNEYAPDSKECLRNSELVTGMYKEAHLIADKNRFTSKEYNENREVIRKNPKYSFKYRTNRLLSKFDSRSDKVYFSVASIPERESQLRNTISSIIKSADKIFVYLNRYKEIPDFLINEKIVVLGFNGPDLNATGKVAFLDKYILDGYIFIIDDDIIYPKNYVAHMIDTIKKYDNKVLACVHGSIFTKEFIWYYQRSRIFPMRHSLKHDVVCNLPGSGTLAFHSSMLKLQFSDFRPYTIVDLCFAILCAEQKVPIISVARKHGWLKPQEAASDLFTQFNSVGTIHSVIALNNRLWSYEHVSRYAIPVIQRAIDKFSENYHIDDGCFDLPFIQSFKSGVYPEVWSPSGNQYRQSMDNLISYLRKTLLILKGNLVSCLLQEDLYYIDPYWTDRLKSIRQLIYSYRVNLNHRKSDFNLSSHRQDSELINYLEWQLGELFILIEERRCIFPSTHNFGQSLINQNMNT